MAKKSKKAISVKQSHVRKETKHVKKLGKRCAKTSAVKA